MHTGAYGQRLGLSFRSDCPPTLVSETAGGHRLAATDIRCDASDFGLTAPIGQEEAYLLGFHFRAVHRHELWLDGQTVSTVSVPAGSICIRDLLRNPVECFDDPFHTLQCYVPRVALVELACDLGKSPLRDLACDEAAFFDDVIVGNIARSLHHHMVDNRSPNQLLVDHLLLALASHVVFAYGGSTPVTRIPRGGLAPWQQRRALDLLRENLVDGISLAYVANACRLSSSAFLRGFRKSMGVPPHQWLLLRRIDRAVELMREGHLPLADVALSSGFSDQSHFTRTFASKMGVSPGAWRNRRCA
jgi:AraC family transcriptional regulator